MKKSFLILVSATLMLFSSGCEKTPSIDTFNSFMEEAFEGCVTLREQKRYVDGELYWEPKPDADAVSGFENGRMSTSGTLIFYPDGTCRKCYTYGFLLGEKEEDRYFYRTFYWEADAERRVIRLTDNALREAGSAFAVTELKLTSRSGDRLTFEGMIPTPMDLMIYQSIAKQEVRSIFSGILYGAAEREKAEALYRSDTDDPLLK